MHLDDLVQKLELALQEKDRALERADQNDRLYHELKETLSKEHTETKDSKDFKEKEQIQSKQHSSRQSKQMRELKMALMDSEFQLRRFKEDMATQRTMVQLERVKLVKNYEQKIVELKNQIQSDNQSWMKRFDIRNGEYKTQLFNSNKEIQTKMRQQIMEIQLQYEGKLTQSEIQKQEVSNYLKNQIKSAIVRLQKQKKESILATQKKWKERISDIQNKNAKDMEKQTLQFQQKINLLQSQNMEEQSLHEITKNKLQRTKIVLSKEIHQLKDQKQQLQQQLKQVQKQKTDTLKEKEKLLLKVQEVRTHFEQQIKILSEKHEKQNEEVRLKQKSHSELTLQNYSEAVASLQEKLSQLKSHYQKQIEDHQAHLQTIKDCYNERPSRTEDLEMIRYLQDRLWKKQNELEMVGQDLRWHRLQLENKQQIYTRIFTNGCLLRQLKFPVQKTSLRIPLTVSKQPKTRKGKSILNRGCSTKNSSFNENIALTQICSKML